ncbi:MAG: 3-hydroxyacyl-ACP dehydratase FabZ [Desulfarculaceae bacterium]|nr:3-hydroxyacyl-ACP dehydratase FabZ [Desulfarculaceae bacterium]MCF8046652.1 3-hydroxyacyl-ACP dehydratase FabZ [Desulfarculaceae bacterium]MCF8065584.1 3-hydroxyacyl-ACP dehydratase FabZ [Desulfarculaceae bacterium]MCF8096846.1 3-hydroxyacyl-ACP dehydratase FabZ [Desulfarculaceae bacterium]MCF8121844.1 3-hydroxyacyl-ACP dehydratase FabZ [Desulfarculaceae bacterium]
MPEGVLNLTDILEILPHRYPFLLVDRVLELKAPDYVKALKNVTFNEAFFQGHFPGKPVMPGVLVIEAMAQTGGILAYQSNPTAKERLFYFMGMDKVKFRRPVLPGDQLIMELTAVHRSTRAWKMIGKAFVDDQLAVQAELTAALVQ